MFFVPCGQILLEKMWFVWVIYFNGSYILFWSSLYFLLLVFDLQILGFRFMNSLIFYICSFLNFFFSLVIREFCFLIGCGMNDVYIIGKISEFSFVSLWGFGRHHKV